MSSATPAANKRLAGDAALLAVAALLVQGAAIVSTVALARILPLGEFGAYQQLLLVYGIVSPLLFGGIPAALTYYLARARTDEERRGWVFDGTISLAVLGAIFALLLVALRHPLADSLNGGPRLSDALALLAPFAVLTFVAATMPNTLIPSGRAHLSALLSALSAVVYVSCVLSAAVIESDVRALALAMGASAAFSAALAVGAVGRVVGYRVRWRGLAARSVKFLGYGFPLALAGLAGLLGFQFDRLVVSANFSARVFAVYAVGAVELPLTTIVQQSVNSVLLPELAIRHRDGDLYGVGELWREAIRKSSLIILPLFVVSFLLAGDLLPVVFGAPFGGSVAIFRIYLLLMPLRVATYGIIPMAIGRTGVNFGAAAVTLGANAVLAIALVGPLGLKGPAWATVIATTLSVVYYLVRLREILGLGISALLPWRVLALNLAVSVAASVPLLAIAQLDLAPALHLILGGLMYVITAVWALRITRRITDEDWARLLGTIRGFLRRHQGHEEDRSPAASSTDARSPVSLRRE
ncbi:MAG: lipopolysaccharide biosynthesis protein [Solirubrobacterales bacterium]|nr:lipopolysaccharide biosynthesis protein [Solirubrobacterales bacterium]